MTDLRQTLHEHKPTPTAVQLGVPDPPPVRSVSGEGYDRCPVDGCCTVEATHSLDNRWWMYNADPRQGYCGTTWTRTTREGEAHNTSRGMRTSMRTTAHDLGRVYSVPSKRYQDNYDRIDWSK